jgi:hypothetical protein
MERSVPITTIVWKLKWNQRGATEWSACLRGAGVSTCPFVAMWDRRFRLPVPIEANR